MITVKKEWGVEEWFCNELEYCYKRLLISPGKQCSLHFHPIKKETFIVQSGVVRFELAGVEEELGPGDVRTILPRNAHRFGSVHGATIIEVSTHHEDSDCVRLEPSGNIRLS